ncbi:MAG: hypothetical protein M8349_02990 [ANME-2 cluster archaeon]|nr:hypothetical protein [ANME-2 cluster archaeon]MDF1556842.1 hypothetical protein [ANME-2 cluster archaeon]
MSIEKVIVSSSNVEGVDEEGTGLEIPTGIGTTDHIQVVVSVPFTFSTFTVILYVPIGAVLFE